MASESLLKRITFDPEIFGGKPIIRGRRLAVDHVLSMLEAGETPQSIVAAYDWLELDDVRACIAYARQVMGDEHIDVVDKAG